MAACAQLIQKAYKVDPLEYVNCGSDMRIIALIGTKTQRPISVRRASTMRQDLPPWLKRKT